MHFNPINAQRDLLQEQFILVVASLPTGTAAQSTTGCTEGTYRCTVIKNGTGDYSINYNTAFSRAPVVTANALHTSAKLFCVIKSSTTSAVNITVYSDAGTATDATQIHVHCHGARTADQTG